MPGPDLDDDAALVGGVLRQQCQQDLAGPRLDLDAGCVALLEGEVAEFGFGRRIGDQPFRLGQRLLCAAPGGDRLHHRVELRQLLGELDRARGVGSTVDLVGRGGMTRDDGFETILGQWQRHV